ncbi:hypothetical protein NQ315_016043 [Exocentrus adspersus]|uniref:Transposase n=1 Tax=Exocentrus adspersus TaxID=1586481 RepID=A0AAV8V545_9CUCU|nr:hypothetical protein NQ315_016043 [Exocentrus adspersus]
MPRNYRKQLGPRQNRNYDPVYLERAIAAVRRGTLSIRTASEQYAIPYTTLHRWVNNNNLLAYGRPPALENLEEEKLVKVLLICAEWGFPMKSFDIRYIVQQYLNKSGKREKRFSDNLPGLDWFKSFMARHPNLTIKFAENTKRVRAAVTYEVVETYFANLKQSLKDVPSANVLNYDETNFADDPGAVKVVVKRGIKHAHRIMDTSKSSTSVMFAISGDGNLLPPYVVYKAKHLYPGWTEGGFPNSRYNRTVSGWFDANTFEDWFVTTALPYFRNLDGPKLIIGDNLCSHLTISVIQECEKNNIRFVLLPPNSTHLLQPLDVAYFRPFKRSWRSILEKWKLKNRGVLPKTVFPTLLKESIEAVGAKSTANILAGFKACGIVPFNPDTVLQKMVRLRPQEGQERVMETSWTEAIVSHLSDLRSGSNDAAPKRGKRLTVPSGQSIAASDLLPELIEPEDIIEISGEGGNESEELMETEEDNTSEDQSAQTSYENLPSVSHGKVDQNLNKFRNGDFVIVKFKTNKRDRLYAANILSQYENEYTVNTLRKKDTSKQTFFVNPNVPDIVTVEESQIVKKIYGHAGRRGQFVLNDISNYCLE